MEAVKDYLEDIGVYAKGTIKRSAGDKYSYSGRTIVHKYGTVSYTHLDVYKRQFQERSQQAIAELSQKYGKLCQSLSRRILNNEEDAKECVNDCLLYTSRSGIHAGICVVWDACRDVGMSV